MVEYSKADAKLSNTRTTLRINLKMLNGNNLPHKLLLTTRQKTKLRNALNNDMSVDIKFSKAQINKIIQSGGFLGSLLSKLAGSLMKKAIPLAKNILAPLGITAAGSAIDAAASAIKSKENTWFWNNNINNFK